MSDIEPRKGIVEKIKSDPAPAIGILGCLGVVAYSALNYRKKSAATSTSLYVIQTRVAAQGLVVGSIAIGLAFHMYQKFLERNEPHENALNLSSFKDSHTNHNEKH